ncbi:hypothetical protein AAC387_Pa11g1037 [Persea americana]
MSVLILQDMFEEKRSILEPAGALALAGAEAYCKYYGLKDKTVVAITSGANMNFDRLRLVAELADVGRQQEAVLATFIPEEKGSLTQFCEPVGPMNITEFKYRYNVNRKKAVVLYSVGLHTANELKDMMERMESCNLQTIDLSDNDLAKDHLWHLMGGRSNFLDAFSPRWDISLFHYRAQGETEASVLVAIQVPDSEVGEFLGRANYLGYKYELEMNNDALRLLMR